jgi:class 3 adenylate cyclase/ActR/RegA family two-component response regulator
MDMVTFLLTDIEGSSSLWDAYPEAMRAALARHDALLAAAILARGGAVVKSRGEGDSLFAVFDSAADALAAACDCQIALEEEEWPPETPLRVRMAIHTGEADRREGDYFGPAVNRCARLRALAHGGQILLSQASTGLVRGSLPEGVSLDPRGAPPLAGFREPERVFQVRHPAFPSPSETTAPEGRSGATRVLVVDDHGVVRQGMCAYLGLLSDVQVVGEAGDGQQALERLAALDAAGSLPHVVLMDLQMPRMDGIAATAAIRGRYPTVAVLALTSFLEEEKVHDALEAGASGYLLKSAAADEVASAIRALRRSVPGG